MAFSTEPGRTTPYSDDLRWRVVRQRLVKESSYRHIAESLDIALGTVHNIWERFQETGEVSASKAPPRERLLDEHCELLILGILDGELDIYLAELSQHLLEATGVEVSCPTLCRSLKRLGCTRKKVHQIALQRCIELTAQFLAEVSMFAPSMFVWVDESGCNKRTVSANMGMP